MTLRSARLILPLILALTAILAFSQAHEKGMDPIIDAGRDLYIAGELERGATLYHDLVYYYPPAGPYVLAAFVALFGNSLAAFEFFGVIVALIIAIALYVIPLRIAGHLAAFFCTLLFLSLNFTGASTWGANYLFPYAHGTTLGIMFLLLFVWFLLDYGGRRIPEEAISGSRLSLSLAVLFALLAAWSKLEYTLAVAVTFGAFAILRRMPLRDLLLAAGAALVSLLALSSVFGGSPVRFGWIGERLLTASLLQADATRTFYAAVSGVSDWPRNLGLAMAGALGVAAACGILFAIDRRRQRPGSDVVLVLLLFALSVVYWFLASGYFFRAWGALQILLIAALLFRDRRNPILIVAILSAATTVRIVLNLTPDWYGFAMMLPVYLLIVCVLFRLLPEWKIYGSRTALLWLPLLLLLALQGLMQQRERYALKRFAVETPRGTFYDSNVDRARALSELLVHLEGRGGRSLVVLPEGVSINYFSGIRTPLARYAFIPPETADLEVERSTIEEMERTEPELVALVSRDMSEFGSRGFGVDYNQALHAYVADNYVVERAWVLRGFQLILFQRK